MVTIHVLRQAKTLHRLQLTRVPCVGEIIFVDRDDREDFKGHYRVVQVAHVPDSDQAQADVWVDAITNEDARPDSWR